MEALGIQFCFFPFLTLLGLASLLLGCVHLFLCLPFYFLAVGILDGVLLLIIVFHGCFLSHPTRVHCVLHVLGTLWGVVVAVLCSLELFCIVPEEQQHESAATRTLEYPEPWNGVCYGVESRTAYVTSACYASVGGLRTSVQKLFGPIGEENVHRIVAGGQAGIGLVQLLCCGAMAWFCSIETGTRPKAFHAQIPLAFLIAALGCVHTIFCCQYFYVGFAIWVAALILVQALITTKTKGSGKVPRAVNLLGAGLGMALTAINIFGLFCWFEGLENGGDWGFRFHCRYRHETYRLCERRIHFSRPYTDWPRDVVHAELRNFQFVAYAGLILCGLLQLIISLHSMFRKVR